MNIQNALIKKLLKKDNIVPLAMKAAERIIKAGTPEEKVFRFQRVQNVENGRPVDTGEIMVKTFSAADGSLQRSELLPAFAAAIIEGIAFPGLNLSAHISNAVEKIAEIFPGGFSYYLIGMECAEIRVLKVDILQDGDIDRHVPTDSMLLSDFLAAAVDAFSNSQKTGNE